jgi:hypothetical protein
VGSEFLWYLTAFVLSVVGDLPIDNETHVLTWSILSICQCIKHSNLGKHQKLRPIKHSNLGKHQKLSCSLFAWLVGATGANLLGWSHWVRYDARYACCSTHLAHHNAAPAYWEANGTVPFPLPCARYSAVRRVRYAPRDPTSSQTVASPRASSPPRILAAVGLDAATRARAWRRGARRRNPRPRLEKRGRKHSRAAMEKVRPHMELPG